MERKIEYSNCIDDFLDKIICGDAAEIMQKIPDNSIDLVVTDPPYSRKYLYTYKYLADECPRIMKPKASLLVIAGHSLLPDVFNFFADKLSYRWMFCLSQFEGAHARMGMGIEVLWKPMLWFVKGNLRYKGFLRDGVIIEYKRKTFHKWEQSTSWCDYYIQKLTDKNAIVLDPFVGSGTVPVVCQRLGRHYIGIDIDPSACQIAQMRLKNESLQTPLFEETKNY